MSQPIPEGFEFKNKILELEQALLDRHPEMPTLLAQIHRAIQAQPEQVTLLGEKEISIIVNGLKVQTNTEFAQSIVKKTPSSAKALAAALKSGGADIF